MKSNTESNTLRHDYYFNLSLMMTFVRWALILLSFDLAAESLNEFKSDGCSLFPDGTIKQQNLWHRCCVEHDKAYWAGGTYHQRLEADIALKSCVNSVGEPHIANLMLSGVRVGGSPYWPTQFRWGYGWPYGRGYQALTESELAQAAQLWQAYLLSQQSSQENDRVDASADKTAH